MPRMCMHSGHFCLKEVLNMVRQEDIEYMRRAMDATEEENASDMYCMKQPYP